MWCLWRDVETQWRPDHTGLDYTAVRPFIDERFRRRERRLVLWLIQGMEEVTLAVWRERQARDTG